MENVQLNVKLKLNGNIERYKIKLETKDFTQAQEIYYHETFAQIAKLNFVRVLLFLATNMSRPSQLDVKTSF